MWEMLVGAGIMFIGVLLGAAIERGKREDVNQRASE